MGGKGSGGARVGAGRKPKEWHLQALHGSRQRAEGTDPGKKKKRRRRATVVEAVSPPVDLTDEQLAIWRTLAPYATAGGTLTSSTVVAFRDLCEAIVFKRKLLAQVEAEGTTFNDQFGNPKKHPLIAEHRGMMQRVEAGMTRFKLAPIGKELAPDEDEDEDPFAEFDDQTSGSTH